MAGAINSSRLGGRSAKAKPNWWQSRSFALVQRVKRDKPPAHQPFHDRSEINKTAVELNHSSYSSDWKAVYIKFGLDAADVEMAPLLTK